MNNFLKNLYNCLLSNNFENIQTDFLDGKMLFFKTTNYNGYIIAPILKSGNSYISYYENLEKNCESFLEKYNLSKLYIIKILISDSFEQDDLAFLDKEIDLDKKIISINWGVDLSSKKIITLNNQPTKFLNLEKYIKLSLKDENIKASLKPKNYIMSNNTYITYTLIFSIALVHILIALSSTIDKDYCVRHFGISPTLLQDKQYYRLITFLFLHSGLTHLISNLLSLYIFGTRVEKYLGKTAFCLIYFLGGISSGIFSLMFTKSYSIGASGAIFALESATLYFSLKEKIKLDGLDFQTIGIFCIVGILTSFTDKTIDNAGHIGGFLTGFIVCFIYYKLIYLKKIKKLNS